MAAAGQGSVKVVEKLIEAGADTTITDSRGVSACHMAAEVGGTDVVAALVRAGCDCTQMAESAITPLIVAAAAGEEDMVRMLLPALAPVHHSHHPSHLHSHLYSQVRMLLMLTKQKGQSVDALHHDKSAMTALMAASSNGSLTVLHIILWI